MKHATRLLLVLLPMAALPVRETDPPRIDIVAPRYEFVVGELIPLSSPMPA